MKRYSPLVIIGLILLGLVALFLVYNSVIMNRRHNETPPQTGNTSEAPAEVFRQDGSLAFTTPDGKEISRISIEIADNDQARTQGLMGRTSMRQDRGMLFVFDSAEPRSFWMANTPLPLDIIFIDEKKTILNIHRNTRPFSEESLESKGRAMYVVEVNGGWCDRSGVHEGDRIDWSRI